MYKTELKNLDTDDLESIKDSLRILETFLFNIQSIDKDLKKKKLGFSATSRKELRKMYTFWKTSSYNVSHTLWTRKGKKGKEPKKSSDSFGFQEKPNFQVFKHETPSKKAKPKPKSKPTYQRIADTKAKYEKEKFLKNWKKLIKQRYPFFKVKRETLPMGIHEEEIIIFNPKSDDGYGNPLTVKVGKEKRGGFVSYVGNKTSRWKDGDENSAIYQIKRYLS